MAHKFALFSKGSKLPLDQGFQNRFLVTTVSRQALDISGEAARNSTGLALFWNIKVIDWGLTPFLTFSHLYHGGHFTYSCISWFSHTSTPHNKLPKQLAVFPHRLSPLVEDEWRMSHWLLSIIGKNVVRAGIRTHNPWIDSPRHYRLSYRGSAETLTPVCE